MWQKREEFKVGKVKYDYSNLSVEELVKRWNVYSLTSNEHFKKYMVFAVLGLTLFIVGLPLCLVLIGFPMMLLGVIFCAIYSIVFWTNKERKEMKLIVKELRKRGYRTYQKRVMGTMGVNTVFKLQVVKVKL